MADDRKAVLVTGAAGGIGSAVVRALAARGYRVFAAVRGDGRALDGVDVVRMDVTDPGSVTAAVAEIGSAVDGLQAVVNNAGVIVQGPLELVPPDALRRQFEINTLGPAYVTQAALPLLRAGAGRIVNVSAPTARLPFPMMGPIGASKAALESMSAALRQELAPWNMPVVLVVPGATDTRIFAKAAADADKAMAGADPRRVELYRRHLEAYDALLARQRNGPVDPVAKAIVVAVTARRPKRMYVAGSGARMLAILSQLPTGLRERLLARATGLNKVKGSAQPAGAAR